MFFHYVTCKISPICKISTFLIISVFSTLGATLNTRKTIEQCTGAEEAGDELASKVDRILITKKNEMEMPL